MIKEKFVIPFLKSLATGLLVALFASAFFISSPGWKLFFIVLSGTALAAWLAVMLPSSENFRMTKKQTNDMVSLKPQETRIQIIARDPQGAFTRGTWLNLPLDMDTLKGAAEYCLKTGEFSHAMSGPGKPMTRSQYELLRDEMLRRGLLYWIRPGAKNLGVSLTLIGENTIKQLASREAAHVHTYKNGGDLIDN